MLSNYLPDLDPQYLPLVAYVTKRHISDLLTNESVKISGKELSTIYTLIKRAKNGTPLAYLTHSQPFFKDEFYVNSNVLIPRSETEYLVERALTYIQDNLLLQTCNIFDICSGSGCIGISIAKYVSENAHVFLLDISDEAVGVCRKNVQRLIPEHRNIHIIKSDLLKNFPWEDGNEINVLISNPPYIPSSRIPKLEPSVRDYEPHLALDGGKKGYEVTLELLKEAKDHLAKKFFILIELDDIQHKELLDRIAILYPDSGKRIIKDMFGVKRYLEITRN